MTRPARAPRAATSMAAVFRLLGHAHWSDPELARVAASIRRDPDLLAVVERAADFGEAWQRLIEVAEANGSSAFTALDLLTVVGRLTRGSR
jgi:hypothetical protein